MPSWKKLYQNRGNKLDLLENEPKKAKKEYALLEKTVSKPRKEARSTTKVHLIYRVDISLGHVL